MQQGVWFAGQLPAAELKNIPVALHLPPPCQSATHPVNHPGSHWLPCSAAQAATCSIMSHVAAMCTPAPSSCRLWSLCVRQLPRHLGLHCSAPPCTACTGCYSCCPACTITMNGVCGMGPTQASSTCWPAGELGQAGRQADNTDKPVEAEQHLQHHHVWHLQHYHPHQQQ